MPLQRSDQLAKFQRQAYSDPVDDLAVMAVAETIVGWVDDRFGRVGGFVVAGVMIMTAPAVVLLAIAWFLGP